MRTAFVEREAAAGDECRHALGHQDFARMCRSHCARRDVDADAADVAAWSQLNLARVDPRPDLDAEYPDATIDRQCCSQRVAGNRKGGQVAITGLFHEATAESLDRAPNEGVHAVQDVLPSIVAELCGPAGRFDDVNENDR